MKNLNWSVLLFLTATIILPLSARSADSEFVFTYDSAGATHDLFGIQRCVQIDAAMLVKEPALTGYEIVGISVDIPVKEGCECSPVASAWLTKQLQVDGEYNLPDIMQINGEIKNYGTESEPVLRLDLTFPETYTLTAEGVYVGYSLDVVNCNVPGSGWTAKYPIVTVCDIDKPQAMMIHCTKGSSTLPQKYPEWTDLGETRHQALAMRVIMRGKAYENAAFIQPLQTLYAPPGAIGLVYANLTNYGTAPIATVEYSYTIDSQIFSKEIILDTPVAGQFGAYSAVDIPVEVPAETGKYSIDLKITKVNGVPNAYTDSSVLDVEVVPFLPAHRPLIEDYSGFWCGYCPEVYVSLKQLHDKYGEEFLPITYHVDDRIQGVDIDSLPSSSYGLPLVYMGNRSNKIEIANIESIWLRRRRELAPADIDVDIFWTDDSRSALRAESNVRFVYNDAGAEYMLTYALIEDDMSDPDWQQANYFTDSDFTGPYWDLFCGKDYRVKGLVYNDVVVSFPAPKGLAGSLPGVIEGEKNYQHSSVLELSDALCRYKSSVNYGKNIIKNPDKLRVVALLIDGRTGYVCNAASSPYAGEAGVYGGSSAIGLPTAAPSEILFTEYFSFEGLRLPRVPQSGPVIIVTHFANGTIHTEKKCL